MFDAGQSAQLYTIDNEKLSSACTHYTHYGTSLKISSDYQRREPNPHLYGL